MLNPLWLETFKTLVETRNFTRTAEQRFMTQPGVTQHIQKLERACGCSLIIRLGKGLELTEQGQRVYRYALRLSKNEQSLLDSLKFDAEYEGECVIGCSGALAQRLYPVLVAYQQKHPNLTIRLEVAPNRVIFNNIESSAIELGIVTQQPDQERFTYERIGNESLALLLPANRLVSNGLANTLKQLGLIDHPDAMHYLRLYFSHCGESELMQLNPAHIPISGYINQLSQILLPVSKGLGFTVLPSSVLTHFPHADELFVYPTKHQVCEPLFLVKTPHRALPLRYKAIQGLITDTLAEH